MRYEYNLVLNEATTKQIMQIHYYSHAQCRYTHLQESIFSVEEDVVQNYVSDTSPLPSERPMLQRARDECRQLTWKQLDMVVMDGLYSRGRAKVLPHNTTELSDIKNVVRYILNYVEDHIVLLPGRIPGYKRDDLQLFSSSTTK